jgi:FkbH-like protein
MAVRLDDFAAVRVGWDDKTNSIRQIANQLSVGIDSLVFVDDSPVECAQVQQQLPNVTVVVAPADEPWNLASTVMSVAAFDLIAITDEDRHRAEEYRAQLWRSELESTAVSREDFLRSLGIVLNVVDAHQAPLTRFVQLLQKTNQFNLTTKRHSAVEVERLAALPMSQAIALRYRDRFGDGGVVGAALCYLQSGNYLIDTFLLSCRVIGRGVETALLSHLIHHAEASGASCVIGEYIPTSKNAVCASFYPSHGFELVSRGSDGSLLYRLQIANRQVKMPDWVAWEV